jgi:hypothetical protein
MASFKIIHSRWQPPHLVFDTQMLSGNVSVGESFSVWDTRHRYDFVVAAVRAEAVSTLLFCTADFLHLLSPTEKWPDMFGGKQVDTADPTVAQSYSHRGS